MNGDNQLEQVSTRASAVAVWDSYLCERISKIDPMIYSQSEAELEKNFNPTPTDFFLRKRFWEVSKKSQDAGLKNISTSSLYDGICSRQNFNQSIIKSDYKLCWILLPIQSHMDLIEESLYFALKKVRDELLTMPVNEKTAGHLLKAVEYLSNRYLGPVIQKIESKNLNVDMTPSEMVGGSDDISKKFSDLKKSITTATNAQVIDVNDKDPS